MMALAFGPTSCSSGLVPKSELLHSPAAQYGFVPKHSHHGGKYPALRAEKPFSARLRLSEIITMLASVMPSGSRFERSSMRSFFSEAVFLLSLILKHGMLRVGLMQTDGSLLTIRQHQRYTQILKRLKSMKEYLRFL